MTDLAIDLFAGPGGWDEGARMIGLPGRTLGLEWDAEACATGLAAGHDRYKADLSLVAVDKFGPFRGLIASPPCQAYSTAGKGLGKLDQPRILAHLARIRDAGRWLHYSREGWHDDRSPLVLEPVRWALQGRPEWIACEQVPAVLPFWEAFGDVLRDHGYTVATGKLSSEQYGVPQTRKRAILVASRGAAFGGLPAPTHQPYSKRKPFDPTSSLPRWVSMAEALGWDDADVTLHHVRGSGMTERHGARPGRKIDEPSFATTGKTRSWEWHYQSSTMQNSARRDLGQPAPTIAFGHDSASAGWVMHPQGITGVADPRAASEPAQTIGAHSAAYFAPAGVRKFGPEVTRVAVEQASRLQSFPAAYPWQGSKTKQYEQIGNAIPPLLATAILGNLLNIPQWREVCASMTPERNDERPAA